MTHWWLIRRNLAYHRRSGLAVALAVAVAVAVLTGALMVGDSVRGSLRSLALSRLGRYDEVLVTERFFRAALADELAATPGFDDFFSAVVPAIVVRGTIEVQHADGRLSRAGNVTVIGCTERFWSTGGPPTGDVPRLAADQIMLNAPLAGSAELGAQVGDEIVLRIGRPSQIPADSPLGRKIGTTRSRTLKVRSVIPDQGLGSFTLSPSQQSRLCAFVDLTTMQSILDQPGKVNAILLAGKSDLDNTSTRRWLSTDIRASQFLANHFRPKLSDYGLALRNVVVGDPEQPALDYYNLTSERMLLDAEAQRAALAVFGEAVQPALTYLANDLECSGRHVPYSTITAIDSTASLGPLVDANGQPLGPLADDEIVLVDWAAQDLKAAVGDEVRITYFEPETTHGAAREKSARFRLKAVVPLAPVDGPPRKTNDPDLTPELAGVTDRKSIRRWDPPFPFDADRIRPRDDEYWNDHRTTPKAYVSLRRGRELWASRFGETTSLRIAPDRVVGGTTSGTSSPDGREQLADALVRRIDPTAMGFEFRPVKRYAVLAAAGTTPFDALLLLLSTFVIAAALMLVAILFRLAVDLRAAEFGLLLAVGWPRGRVLRLHLAEAMLVAGLGGFVGIMAGIGYAWLLLVGLRTWWLGAIGEPILELHVTWQSLAIGYLAGWLVCGLTIAASQRQLRRTPPRRLLAGATTVPIEAVAAARRRRGWQLAAMALFAVAATLAIVSGRAGDRIGAEVAAGVFFASGALTLAAALTGLWASLRWPRKAAPVDPRLTLRWLAWQSAARNPLRTALCIGLTAVATFLIIATSAFRLDVADSWQGFDLIAHSTTAVYHDPGTAAGRFALGLVGPVEKQLADCRFLPFRLEDGDDASCENLYRPRQPTILGVPRGVSGGVTSSEAMPATLFPQLRIPLNAKSDGGRHIPVVLDENTARYSLGLWGGVGETIEVRDGRGQPATLEVVNLLRGSVLQGYLLIDEADFLQLFPDSAGYRLFLIDTTGHRRTVGAALEEGLGDYGFDVMLVQDRLAALMAVQNTYLATFQSLGGLGLLLGMFGLAAVELRSVVERRGELALLRAVGFRRRRIAALVLCENSLLVLAGLGIGIAAATVAIWPYLVGGGARVPLASLVVTLALVLVAGLTAGWIAARATARAPLLPALRGE